MVNMHSIPNFKFVGQAEVQELLIVFELVQMLFEVVFPSVLSDKVQAMNLVTSRQQPL